MDLVVDFNFRMDSSALYSDIVLPAASWYEKADINSTDMHSFIHPFSAAIAPVWEAKTDWEIFKNIALATSQLAKKDFNQPRYMLSQVLFHTIQLMKLHSQQSRIGILANVKRYPGKQLTKLQ